MSGLSGEWGLVGWEKRWSDGTTTYPFGSSPKGLLIYTHDKKMIVQMIADVRQSLNTTDPIGGTEEERAAAYSGNLSYFGTYHIDGNEVVHDIEGSAYPNWTGTRQSRPYHLTGDRLVLETKPDPNTQPSVVNAMIWQRKTSKHSKGN